MISLNHSWIIGKGDGVSSLTCSQVDEEYYWLYPHDSIDEADKEGGCVVLSVEDAQELLVDLTSFLEYNKSMPSIKFEIK